MPSDEAQLVILGAVLGGLCTLFTVILGAVFTLLITFGNTLFKDLLSARRKRKEQQVRAKVYPIPPMSDFEKSAAENYKNKDQERSE